MGEIWWHRLLAPSTRAGVEGDKTIQVEEVLPPFTKPSLASDSCPFRHIDPSTTLSSRFPILFRMPRIPKPIPGAYAPTVSCHIIQHIIGIPATSFAVRPCSPLPASFGAPSSPIGDRYGRFFRAWTDRLQGLIRCLVNRLLGNALNHALGRKCPRTSILKRRLVKFVLFRFLHRRATQNVFSVLMAVYLLNCSTGAIPPHVCKTCLGQSWLWGAASRLNFVQWSCRFFM